jgi:hypothetical protein
MIEATTPSTMMKSSFVPLLLFFCCCWTAATAFVISNHKNHHVVTTSTRSSQVPPPPATRLYMNLFDGVSKFLQDREGDFIQLSQTEESFGPGPVLLLYNVPFGIDDDEYLDMLSDGAPEATATGIMVDHVTPDLMELSVEQALETVLSDDYQPKSQQRVIADSSSVPVLFFSGFKNSEMMKCYNIVGEEIYKQWGGQYTPACAKAVPNSMNKSLGQVLEEISGDHMHAMSAEETEDTRM